MRLFTAVLPPPSALAEVSGAVRVLHDLPGARRLRWTEPAGWHVTLAFYGETDEDLVPDLRAALAREARAQRPFPLRFTSGGRFGNRALWAGVTGDVAALERLAAAAEEAGRAAGALPASDDDGGYRPFHPHLTLARGRRAPVPLQPFAAALSAFEGGAWRAGEVALVRSDPTGPGPRYTTAAAWRLGP